MRRLTGSITVKSAAKTFDLWGRPGTWDLRVSGHGGGLADIGEAPVGRIVVP